MTFHFPPLNRGTACHTGLEVARSSMAGVWKKAILCSSGFFKTLQYGSRNSKAPKCISFLFKLNYFLGGVGVPNFETHPYCFFHVSFRKRPLMHTVDLNIYICLLWVWPAPSNSDHQDYSYIFGRRSRTKPSFDFICHRLLLGGGHTQCIVSTRFGAPDIFSIDTRLLSIGPSMALQSHPPQWKGNIRQNGSKAMVKCKEGSDGKARETTGICMTNYILYVY